ncbi:hypothetical protein EDD21DRAFT_406024 [Dissophora ornata]|nr:hypothetical protein BGZ58_001569 [Dissophora ornata]KAI8599442.1 hypothetical protein EDD21DRAFT_406024 [Dissophora ornata]
MSRIPCQNSAHWLASSLTRAGICRNSRKQSAVAGSRISRISTIQSTSNFGPCFSTSSTSAGPASRKTTAEAKKVSTIDPATLDSISKTLISDLYTSPSSTKAKVTLEDVLALKPANSSISVDEFNKLKDAVATSFNVGQLKDVLRSQNMPANGRKSVLVNQIMILMNLNVKAPKPKPPVVEDPYTAAEPVFQKVFPSNKRELFFILGSEGDSLRGLEREKNVRISINIANETYIIRGASESIQEAQSRISEIVAVTEEVWNISSYSDKDLVMKEPPVLEDIARRSETFVSAGDENTLIIAGRSSKDMEEAKRLFDLKLHKSTSGAESFTFLHQEDELKPVGMFPVFDSVSMTVDESQKSFFRVCQTEPDADRTLDNLTIHPVQSSPGNIGTLEELRKHLKSSVDGALEAHQIFDLSAQFGQLLFHNRNPQMTNLPFPTAFDTLDLEEWLKDADKPYFLPSLPFFKAVTTLPLVSPKSKTIEAEYIPSSRLSHSTISQDMALSPLRITFTLNNEGELCVRDGKVLNRQFFANLMMLGQPTDIQIRSELSTRIEAESPALKELMSQTTLPYANRLQCPSFFSFKDLSTTPAASQVGLGSAPTHTLSTILFKTSGVFNYHGLPLVASDIVDQHGHVRRQELKLLPVPLASGTVSVEGDATSTPLSLPATSSLENWDDFINATLHLSRTL